MFIDRLFEGVREKKTPVCIGLDPAIDLMPDEFFRLFHLERESAAPADMADACRRYALLTLDAVADLVPIVKPQSAYFERWGSPGIAALEAVIAEARSRGLLVLLDAKRGDIGSTSEAYASAYLGDSNSRLEVDAITLSPYLGPDSLQPFVDAARRASKGIFVCCRTSNPGASALQELLVGGRPVYDIVGEWVSSLGADLVGDCGYSSVGVVVGATTSDAARALRSRLAKTPFLVPGYGAQGGSLEAIRSWIDQAGTGAIVNASRTVMYPHRYGSQCIDPKDSIRAAARQLVADVRGALG